MKHNFIVKVEDAKLPVVQKALKSAGIRVRSILEVYKEESEAGEENNGEEEREKKEA